MAKARRKATAKKPSATLDALTQETEQAYGHSDSREVGRARDLLAFSLTTIDEQIAETKTTLAALQAERAQVEARVAGLTRVLGRR